MSPKSDKNVESTNGNTFTALSKVCLSITPIFTKLKLLNESTWRYLTSNFINYTDFHETQFAERNYVKISYIEFHQIRRFSRNSICWTELRKDLLYLISSTTPLFTKLNLLNETTRRSLISNFINYTAFHEIQFAERNYVKIAYI
jgi:hypothetical protein